MMTARGDQERRSLLLWPEEWEKLDELAGEFGTCPPTGPKAGQPSWRSLVKEIARGAIGLERLRDPEPVERQLSSIICPICGQEIVYSGPGAQHLAAHVRAGEAEDLGEEVKDWTKRYVRT